MGNERSDLTAILRSKGTALPAGARKLDGSTTIVRLQDAADDFG